VRTTVSLARNAVSDLFSKLMYVHYSDRHLGSLVVVKSTRFWAQIEVTCAQTTTTNDVMLRQLASYI
jgi:hypothetical protein